MKTPESKSSSQSSTRSPWIVNRWADILLVVAAPVPVFLVISGAREVWSAAAVSSFVMVWAIGHHLPGMMRAYGDPDLFKRFKIRFLIAPLLLIGVCYWSFREGMVGVSAIAGVWGWWHYLMQAYGFVRIYDAKIGSFAATTRWLDWGMCVVWFAAAIILNDNTTYGFVQRFYNSGIPIPAPEFFHNLRLGTIAAASIITLLFFANFVYLWLNGRRPSFIKVVLMATTFAYFWYSAATVTNIVVAYAFFELFHDVQYLTIVWAFNRNRVKKNPGLRGFTHFLFRPRSLLITTYVALVCGYGLLRVASEQVASVSVQQFLFGCFLASTLLHYYFDGFIWKVREKETQKTLEINSMATSYPSMLAIPGWLRHAMLWMLFIVPLAYMTHKQKSFRPDPFQDSRHIMDCVPKSINAKFDRGLALEVSGMALTAKGQISEATEKIDEAIAFYKEAQEMAPHHEPSRARLVRIYNRRGFKAVQEGQRDAALREFRASLDLDPDQIDIEVLVRRLRKT